MAATVSGVVFADLDSNGAFSPGEGLAGATVNVGGIPGVLTDANGAYAVPDVPAGTLAVTFQGTGVAGLAGINAEIGAADVTVNLRAQGPFDFTNIIFSSTSARVIDAYELVLIGSATSATGNTDADYLVGNAVDNLLTGAGSDDQLWGGDGIDTAVFAGPHQNYRIYTVGYTLATPTYVTDNIGAEGHDELHQIERLQFAGVTYGLARAQQDLTSNFDGGRFDDVLFQEASTGTLAYRNMDNGVRTDFRMIAQAADHPTWHVVGTGDCNVNGYADIFIQDSADASVFTLNFNRSPSILPATSPLTSDWAARAVGDIDGDGYWDVVVQSKTTGTTYFASQAQGSFTSWGVVSAGLTADWQAVTTGDVNFDGYADVIVQNLNAPGAPVYYANMAGGVFSGWGVVSAALTPDWRAVAAGDLNGDGYAEVIVRNQSDGTVYYADLSGGALHWGVVTASVTPDWQVKAIADADNDGYRDVVVQEGATGAAYYANMNAGTFSGWGVVSTDTGTDWHVV